MHILAHFARKHGICLNVMSKWSKWGGRRPSLALKSFFLCILPQIRGGFEQCSEITTVVVAERYEIAAPKNGRSWLIIFSKIFCQIDFANTYQIRTIPLARVLAKFARIKNGGKIFPSSRYFLLIWIGGLSELVCST